MSKRMAAGVIVLMVGLILLAIIATDVYNMAFKKTNIEDKSYGGIEDGEFIDGELTFVFDKVGELETKKRFFGIPYKKVTSSVYAVVVNGGYVLLQSSDDTDKLDSMVEDTKKYLNGEKQSSELEKYIFTAKAVEINDKQLEITGEYFSSKGVDSTVWKDRTCSNVLIFLDKTMLIAELCISCGLIFIGVILIILGRRSTFGETVYVGEHPDTEESGTSGEAEKNEEESKPESEE